MELDWLLSPFRPFQFSHFLCPRHSTTIDFFAYYLELTKVNGNSQWLCWHWRHTS
jgi:hypothetical protein